jgi:class 3 adenylate cyclase
MTGVQDLEVRFAEHAGDYLAFAVFGEGLHDVVVQQGICPIDLMWELPQLAAFMEALGRIARVIVYDARNCGASDPITDPDASLPETFADDLLAVLDAVESDRATVLDMGGSNGVFFGATYPERTRSLILVNLRPSFPEFSRLTAAQAKQLALRIRSPEWLRIRNPRVAHDPVLRRWWGRASRLVNSPEVTVREFQDATHIDYEPALSAVRVPTLVLHRRDDRLWDIETSRAAASRIPGARFVELPGAEHDLFLGDTAPVLAEIERFLDEPEIDVGHDRPLATVLFTDIVDSTEQLAARGDDAWRHVLDTHDQTMDQVITTHRGRFVKQTGDGILATFDGPARAVHCAAAILDNARDQGITLRAGLHTGEIELRPSDVAGIAVHTASRIAALADPNEILVSRTVVDLTAGSGLQFAPRGEHQLKGVPGSWPLFAAQREAAA